MTYYDLSKKLQDDYADLDEASKQYPLVWDSPGNSPRVLRFKANAAVRWIFNRKELSGHPNLNELWLAASAGNWPDEDLRQLYRMMGYSLCGFLEIFHS